MLDSRKAFLDPERLFFLEVTLYATLEKLWELQSVMSTLAEKETALNEKPEAFAGLDEEYHEERRQIEELAEQIDQARVERRAAESDLRDQQETLKKFQSQLMKVKNQVQYAAALKEIEVARKSVKDGEEALLNRMSEIEEAETELATRKEAFTDLESRYKAGYSEWQKSLSGLKREITKIKERSSFIEGAIPEKLRREFHRIFKHRKGIAVSRIENDSCTACRYRIRSQVMQQLRRGEVTICEGCGRISFLERTAS